jgi:hypothetical protein
MEYQIPIGHVKKSYETGFYRGWNRDHFKMVEDVCSLFELSGISQDEVKMK